VPLGPGCVLSEGVKTMSIRNYAVGILAALAIAAVPAGAALA
jgi:hypothetical protein